MKVCQSCGMPITSNDQLGTNKDGSINHNYCKYCYKDGKFLNNCSMEEYIEQMCKFASQANMTPDQMRQHCLKLYPTLKRWKKTI